MISQCCSFMCWIWCCRDGREHVGYKSKNLLRKQMKAMRMYAEANQDHGLQFDKQFIPVSLWLQFWLIMTRDVCT